MSFPQRPRSPDGKRPQMPEIEQREGEDPMDILVRNKETIRARIRGIDSRGLLEAYDAAERKHCGARKPVLRWIDERRQEVDWDE